MKISELIKKLNDKLTTYGDLDVTVTAVEFYFDDARTYDTENFYLEERPYPKNGNILNYPLKSDDYYLKLNIAWD